MLNLILLSQINRTNTIPDDVKVEDPSNRTRIFNPKMNYDFELAQFRIEFNQKWNNRHASPSKGLDGYVIVQQIGRGGFGQVYLVNQIGTKFHFACKIMEKEYIAKKKQITHVINEKEILSCINFPNLIKLIFSSKNNNYLFLGLPFLIGGELFKYHRTLGKFNENDARFYAAQVFLAIQYLHNVQVAYRDLKPENICFERNGYVTLIDFGFAKRITTRTMSLCGTPEFLAPEVISATPYGTTVDWWAFGILLYEFVHGESPFSIYPNEIIMFEKIIINDYEMPNYFSENLKHLIRGLLKSDMSKRLGTTNSRQIHSHPWFKDVDWFGILSQNLNPPYVPNVAHSRDTIHFYPQPRSRIVHKSKNNKYELEFASF